VESALCFNFFFLPPTGTFTISAFSDWIALLAFLVTAIVISTIGKIALRRRTIIGAMNTTNASLLRFCKWLYQLPDSALSLTAIADGVVNAFQIDYCSIHNLSDGSMHDVIGQATKKGFAMPGDSIGATDHFADLSGTINEYDLDVCYITVKENQNLHLLFAYKTANPDREFLSSLSYVISIRAHELISAST
jgi:Osmosensitive K+ channel histidine kinase